MCTIGNVFSKTDNAQVVFKQCDLTGKSHFFTPEIKTKGDISYLPFMRDNSEGAWCGINNYGVSFVAADSYLDEHGKERQKQLIGNPIFEQYMKIISDCKTAAEAAAMMEKFYTNDFSEPDIILIADPEKTYFIEAWGAKEEVQVIERVEGHFASTNHFRMVYGAVPYSNNHSTYLRLQRAESILQTKPSLTGVKELLKDRYYGDSVWSVCRTAQKNIPSQEDPYYTQASAIFVINDSKSAGRLPLIDCYYQINGNPSVNDFIVRKNIFQS